MADKAERLVSAIMLHTSVPCNIFSEAAEAKKAE